MAENLSRFALLFEIDGNWEQALGKMSDMFENVTGASEQTAKKVTDASAQITSTLLSLQSLKGTADGIFNSGISYFQSVGNFIQAGIKSVQPLESMSQRIRAVTHSTEAATREIIGNALELAEKTPFVSNDVAALAQALALAKVPLDALKDSVSKADLTLEIASKRGFAKLPTEALDMAKTMKVTTTSMLADLATIAGTGPERMQFFVYGMQRALSTGQLAIIRDDMPEAFRKAIFETTGNKSKVTAAKAMDNLFKFLAKEGQIGAAVAGSTTFAAIEGNFADLIPKMFRSVLGMPNTGGAFDEFKKIFGNLYATISKTFDDPKFLISVKEAMKPLLTISIKVAKAFGAVVSRVFEWIRDNPKIVKAVVMVSAAIAGLMVVAGGLASAFLGIGIAVLSTYGVIMGFQALMATPAFLAFLAGAWEVILVIGLVVASIVAVKAAYETNFGGFRDFIDKTAIVLQALGEGIMNMTSKTTHFSKETADSLQKVGLTEFVLNLLSYANRIYNFFRSMGAGLVWAYNTMAPSLDELGVMFDTVSDAVKTLFSQIGSMLAEITGVGPQFKETSGFGLTLGGVLGGLAGVILRVVEFAALLVVGFAKVITWVLKASDVILNVFQPWSALKELVGGIVDAFDDLLQGDVIGFFLKLGATISDMAVKPLQFLLRALTMVADATGKGNWVPKELRTFAQSGFSGMVSPQEQVVSQPWRMPGMPAVPEVPPMLSRSGTAFPPLLAAPSLVPVAATASNTPAPLMVPSKDLSKPSAAAVQSQGIDDLMTSLREGLDLGGGAKKSAGNAPLPPIDVHVMLDGTKVTQGVTSNFRRSAARMGG